MAAITQDEAELAALDHAERTAAAAVRDDSAAFRLGGGPLLPVLDDERRLAMARQSLARVRGKYLADIADLYVATAADWREAGS
jgi:outer membrane protein TolC